MRFILLVLSLCFVVGCSSDEATPATPAAAVDDFCVAVCGWADKCGGFYPEACGDLCSAPSCVDACTAEIKPPATAPSSAELAACLEGVAASTRDCTAYRPHPADCGTFLVLPATP